MKSNVTCTLKIFQPFYLPVNLFQSVECSLTMQHEKVLVVTPVSALPHLKCIPTMPFPFVYSSKGARTDAGMKIHLTGLNLPVVTRVPLVPRPLYEEKTKMVELMQET